MTKITVFGAGYVGSVTAACLADLGHQVICMDIDKDKIQALQNAQSPIYEPGLEGLLQKNLDGNLTFTTDIEWAVDHGEIQFIAVGTPSDQDGSADLRYVLSVAQAIGQYRQQSVIVVNKSTVPVGTAHQVKAVIESKMQARSVQYHCSVVSNPEFLREGTAIADFMEAERVIVGADDDQALQAMETVYQPLIQQNIPFLTMDVLSAELTKYACNAFLATKISFINEISELAEKKGADIEKIRHGMGLDSRIGSAFLHAGCGYGGSCFPKDVRALNRMAAEADCQANILTATEAVNERRKNWIYEKIASYFQHHFEGLTIAIWGLAFKPNTDDLREAASCVLMEKLWSKGVCVQAYDPAAIEQTRQKYPTEPALELSYSLYDAVVGADALAVVTEWPEFKQADFAKVKSLLRQPTIFDGRNLLDRRAMQHLGFDYYSVGRPAVEAGFKAVDKIVPLKDTLYGRETE